MTNIAKRSFIRGEQSPTMYAATDTAAYALGLRTLRNAIVLRTGGVQSRSGTEYLGTTKSNGAAWLVEAVFDDDEGYVLEFGNLYVRPWLDGALISTSALTKTAWSAGSVSYAQGWLVTNGGNTYVCILAHTSGASTEPGVGASWETVWYNLGASASAVYEFPTPYLSAQLQAMKAQAKVTELDVVTIAHRLHEPAALTRIVNPTTGAAATEYVWVLNDIDFASTDNVPQNVAVSGTGGSGWGYTVTAITGGSGGSGTESGAGAFVRTNLGSDLTIAEVAAELASANRTITWDAVADATAYRVYFNASTADGTAYYVQVLTNSFVDNGSRYLYGPSTGFPPQSDAGFDTAGDFPSVVGAYQQRLLLAGSDNAPDVVRGSQTAVPYSFDVSDPIVDSDAMSWRQVGRRLNRIRHFAEVAQRLVQFSSTGESIIQGDTDGILRPGEVNPRQFSENGAAFLSPLVVNDSALYVQARGAIVRDIAPIQASGFAGSDLTLQSAHLVDGFQLVDWCYQQTPNSVIWAVRDDGTLLSLTYVRELGVLGWATHDTDGEYESVACVSENNRDVVYAVVKRTIDSATVRYVERFTDRLADTPVLMDSAIEATTATTTLSGLDHLEGEAVSVVDDTGAVIASPYNSAYTTLTVTSGAITVPEAGTYSVGLPYVSDIQTLDIDAVSSTIKDKGLFIGGVKVWVEETGPFYAGPREPVSATSVATLELQEPKDEDGNVVTELDAGVMGGIVLSTWNNTGRVFLRNVDPSPMTVLAISPQGLMGGR